MKFVLSAIYEICDIGYLWNLLSTQDDLEIDWLILNYSIPI